MKLDGLMVKDYTNPIYYIVELEDGVWLSTGQNDPPRTLVKENAKGFLSLESAKDALHEARKYRPFKNARIY